MNRDSPLSRNNVESVSPAKSFWRYHSHNPILSHILHRTLCESFLSYTETNAWTFLHLVRITQAHTLVEQITLNIYLEMSPVRHNFVKFFIILCWSFFVISYHLECSMLRTALFWIITQWVVEISYRRFGTTCRSHIQGLTLEAGNDRLSRNASKKFLPLATS
jgi:hypothetical protein